jgi:PKD repeat protein
VLALAGPASALPVASFTHSPAIPLTGQTVTFTSTSTGATIFNWDLDGDDVCDDAQGAVVTRSFPVAGAYAVKLCAGDGLLTATQTQPLLVQNRPPTASFTIVPVNPLARELVVLTSAAADPDGPIVLQEWDLNGDGVYGDQTGEAALARWRRPGTYPVALRVTDRDGATDVLQQSVVVAPRPPKQFGRTPIVRIIGVPTDTGAYLRLLAVSAPKGAHVGIRCRGADCPYKRKRTISEGRRIVLRAMAGNFDAGAVIEVRVTKPETIGRYTRIKIRAGRRPGRVDRCLMPGQPNKPLTDCES